MADVFAHRLHLLCAAADGPTVNAALAKVAPGQVLLGPLDGHTGTWGASGQWREAEASALLAALAALPVRVSKGPPLGLVELEAKVIHAGEPKDLFDPHERETWGRALWGWAQGERPVTPELLDTPQK